jgi:enterochelin esterase family protein
MSKLTDPAARSARANKLVADVTAQGGTPLEDAADRAVFLVNGVPQGGSWAVAGSFTSWSAGALPMSVVPGTNLYVLDTHVPRGGSPIYKLFSGGAGGDGGDEAGVAAPYFDDLLAQNVDWDGFDRGGIGTFNAIVYEDEQPAGAGRLVALRGVHSATLGDSRDVFVYLPTRYDDGSCDVLPSIVFHDGNESLTRTSFAAVADTTYAATPAASAVLVFVALPNQDIRIDEYTFLTTGALGDMYGTFLKDELLPIVDARFRVCTTAPARGLAGASLGGLISTYLAFQSPSTWGYIGAQSASYFWDNNWMITRAGMDPVVPVRVYLDTGCPDAVDNCTVVRDMNTALTAKKYDETYVEVTGVQHDWPYWAARLPKELTFFRQGKMGCD